MIPGVVVSYDPETGIGAMRIAGSDRTVAFIRENGFRIISGRKDPEFSSRRLLRNPRVGDEVVLLPNFGLTQALMWSYEPALNNEAIKSVDSRPQYRCMLQFESRDKTSYEKRAFQVFYGFLEDLNHYRMDELLSKVTCILEFPSGGGAMIVTTAFWQKRTIFSGSEWEDCDDPRI